MKLLRQDMKVEALRRAPRFEGVTAGGPPGAGRRVGVSPTG